MWRDENPDEPGNIRDHATIEQLLVLSNLESMNAELIKQGISREERLKKLHDIAVSQMTSLLNSSTLRQFKAR